ncbi:MAG: DUF2066 domain-containing protein [Gammaproteobacteria bacterium]|nr:DUF2066 domain-containing protein [Gammaproteobacteria bacterium]
MKERIGGWLIFVFLLCGAGPCWAQSAAYTATIKVNSQSEADREQGVRTALAQVVKQVSGDPALATQLNINSIKQVYSYVTRYRYQMEQEEVEEDDADAEEDDGEEEEGDVPAEQVASSSDRTVLNLTVEFDPKAVDALIKTAKTAPVENKVASVATVDANLTHVLFWLVVDEGGKPQLVENDEEDKLAKQVKFTGKTKGLDLMLPMADLDDLGALTAADVLRFNMANISQASARYGTDLVLVASVLSDNKHWKAKWLLLKNGKRFSWSEQGVTREGVILSGLLKASDLISSATAVEVNNEEHIVLTVVGIGNVTHYASVNAYLQSLSEVSSIQILRVEPTKVIFDVTLANADRAALMKALQTNTHLVLDPSPSPHELNYIWKG